MSGFEGVDYAVEAARLMPRWLYLLLALPLLFAGFVQSFWGNDPYLGWAITVIASVIIATPLSSYARQYRFSSRQNAVTIFLFVLIMWISLGVGELPEKTEMMLDRFPEPRITGF
jgi:uncharacterized membrane protein YjjP (DUF1212 family)